MVRKPNYQFERQERDREKAAKKAARLEAKRNKAGTPDGETADVSPEENDQAE